MKISELKKKIFEMGISPHQVRDEIGGLRLRSTWEFAYEKYCCYEQLPVIETINTMQEANNIVDFVPPVSALLSPVKSVMATTEWR
ncbi:MAG: hypothetical protein F6K22_38565 [Okeania sp. SIO2F4]|uniref:hypothetical protein n=1 Tax=Okeania sp. SIO2F4 TaxID=2607790 RepID=UPI0014292D73|nr:hypothetical protein [Okeania sp. SIO2F4]NES08162.1 hypothetical protein [Okeania sp. SIO2F4]